MTNPHLREDIVRAQRAGFVVTQARPFGYDFGGGRWPRRDLVVNEGEAAVVRAVYMMVAAGVSTTKVAAMVKPFLGTWDSRRVWGVIRSSTYEGLVLEAGSDSRWHVGRHEAVVSVELADAARAQLRLRGTKIQRKQLESWLEITPLFEEGYWVLPHRIPYGMVGVGVGRRLVLEPGPGWEFVEEVVQRLAGGENLVEVELDVMGRAPMWAALRGWRSEGRWRADYLRGRLLFNPAFVGYSVLNQRVVPAKWGAFLSHSLWSRAVDAALTQLGATRKKPLVRPWWLVRRR